MSYRSLYIINIVFVLIEGGVLRPDRRESALWIHVRMPPLSESNTYFVLHFTPECALTIKVVGISIQQGLLVCFQTDSLICIMKMEIERSVSSCRESGHARADFHHRPTSDIRNLAKKILTSMMWSKISSHQMATYVVAIKKYRKSC
jgi:hypothetical protein